MIDHVITRWRHPKDVHSTRAMRATGMWSHHRLVRSLVALELPPPRLTTTIFLANFSDHSKFYDISDRFDTFDSTCGFWILLPVYRPKFVALGFVSGNISSRLSAIRQPYEPEYGRTERCGGSSAQTGSRNMAETRFSDSATPTSFKIESKPKYRTTSGLTTTTFLANFSDYSEFHDIFRPFRALFKNVLPVFKFHFRSTDCDSMHRIFS